MQPSRLPGRVAPARGEMHNVFFALWPDAETRARIAATAAVLRSGQARTGRWIRPDRYHLTVQFLGEHRALVDALVQSAVAAAAQVDAPPFDLVLDRAGSFDTQGMPCWLGCAETPVGLQQLHDQLAGSLIAQRGRADAHARLLPHVTILRDTDQPLQQRLRASLHWHVDEFVLIDSRIEPFAPYRVLGRWPLR